MKEGGMSAGPIKIRKLEFTPPLKLPCIKSGKEGGEVVSEGKPNLWGKDHLNEY